jgi:hypothetical protein
MKLLIDETLNWTLPLSVAPSDSERHTAARVVQDLVDTLKKFSVYCQLQTDGPAITVRIEAQKVTLGEDDMNELFQNGLFSMFDLTLGYSAISSTDFCMQVLSATPRPLQT